MILHEVIVSNHISYFKTITHSSNSLFQTMKAKHKSWFRVTVCQTMIMVCAELYAQWNDIVIGASGAAWRGAGILRARNEVVVHAFWPVMTDILNIL
jgi:hypothetical protein